MKELDGVIVGVVGRHDAGALERAGATVVHLDPEEFWTAREPSYHAIVIAGLSLERSLAFVRELRADPRARLVPRAIVASPSTSEKLCATASVLVPAGAADEALVAVVDEMALRARSASADAQRILELEQRAAELSGDIDATAKDRSALVHDVRVLLAVAFGFACNLRDGINGPVDDQQRASLERVVAALQDASALLERGPALASGPGVRAAKRVAKRLNVRVDDLVAETISLFTETAAEAGLALAFDHVEPVSAWCDPVQIKQILVNLVVNALKFTPRGGRVVVAVERATPKSARGFDARANVRITVSDSGPGVRPEDRLRVFERGVRLGRDAEIDGQGIGLSVVSEIALAHAGSVEVEDSALGGAAFVVELPVDVRRRESELEERP
ncbi:MAG: HAMP domain-containing histidine kinase [Labilithrix sp.]|nr:HAMP domain-containing histidine kinase [Labilithrix sp.]